MLVLHGCSSSNYYNLVKLALLEKQLPFEESIVYPGAGARYRGDYLEHSPLGKLPCLQTEHGYLSESRCIVEYLERAYPERPLYPEDAFAVGKLLELTQSIDLYLELPARRVLPYLFAGKPVPERAANEVKTALEQGTRALGHHVQGGFEAFALGGEQLTAADLAIAIHVPAVRYISTKLLDVDPLAELPGLTDYLDRMEQRPTIQRIRKDQAEDRPKFFAHIRQLFG